MVGMSKLSGSSRLDGLRAKKAAAFGAVSTLAFAAVIAAGPAQAQEEPPLAAQSAVLNLLQQMTRNGVITPAAAAAMRQRAGADRSRQTIQSAYGAPSPPVAVVALRMPAAPPTPAGVGSLLAADNGAAPPPSGSMVVNLMRLLVKTGVITEDAADALRQEAEISADQARAVASSPGAAAPPLEAGVPPPNGVIRVPYIPQVVRNQIKDDIKKDVMAQAVAEGWASPNALPDWVNRFQLFGDFRVRDEFDLFGTNNISPYIDYATLNATGPIDVNASTNPNGLPFLNTRRNRFNQFSLRAHLGANITVFQGVKATIRLASGSDNSPVSTTQLLGGGLVKKAVWLDQAYLSLTPVYWATLDLGRTPNLFMHTNLLFDDNLNLDGALGVASKLIGNQGLRVFGAAGAFPLDTVPANFPANSGAKVPDNSKWLFAGQFGAEFQPDPLGWSVRGAVGLYDFENVAGQLSTPCDTYNFIRQCSTDSSRPSFMQKGNTLFLIRDITPNPSSPLNYALPQFAGLSYNYRVADVTGEFEMPLFGVTRGQIQAEYARNLAFDPGRVLANGTKPPVTNFDIFGVYHSGPDAWQIKLTVGYPRPVAKGDWNFAAGYKYIEPDATLDAFTDHDFHQGGTNAKGYFIATNYYFANNTWISGRWFSASQVFGPPLTIDVLQLELNTKF